MHAWAVFRVYVWEERWRGRWCYRQAWFIRYHTFVFARPNARCMTERVIAGLMFLAGKLSLLSFDEKREILHSILHYCCPSLRGLANVIRPAIKASPRADAVNQRSSLEGSRDGEWASHFDFRVPGRELWLWEHEDGTDLGPNPLLPLL